MSFPSSIGISSALGNALAGEMKDSNPRLRPIPASSWLMQRRQFLGATAALALGGCSGIDTAEWTEQVMLHDGRMIEVWRRARAHHSGFPNSRRGSDIDFELRYEPMKLYWKGPWNLQLISFEVFDGIPHIAAMIDSATCGAKPKTDYSARFFRFKKVWEEVPQADFPVDAALLNLYFDYWGQSTADDASGLISWQTKADRDGFDAKASMTLRRRFERFHDFCYR